MWAVRRLVLAAAAVALTGTAIAGVHRSSERGATPTAGPTYFGEVRPILAGRCAGCHFAGGIAPFALTSYEQAARRRQDIARVVKQRLMPPWHAARGVRRYLHDPSLTAAQVAAVRSWAARGAPRGDPAERARPLEPVGGGLSRVDVAVRLPAYTPRRATAGDDYRCLVASWAGSAARPYVTGLDVAPGDRREVHHIIVYAARPALAPTVDAWDRGSAGPGYPCYGGPSVTGAQTLPMRLLGGWAPGGAGGDFPAGTGTRIEPGSRLVVQVHYNVEASRPRPDRSLLRLRLDRAVERPGLFLPVVDPSWLLRPRSFVVPARRARVVHAFTGDPRILAPFLDPTADLAAGLAIHSVTLHMHRLGRRGAVTLVRTDGRRERLLVVPRWDFDWQRDYRLATPVAVRPGDRIQIRCEHDNSGHARSHHGGRVRPRTVTWGEDSSDEMCVGFVYVSPR